MSPSGAPRNGHRDVAAAAAAHAVLSGVLRADQPPISDGALDRALEVEIASAGGMSDAPVAAGSARGRHVGRQVVELRSADRTGAAQIIGACSVWGDPSACEPGEFHASFDARWQNMTPFAIVSTAPYLSAAPPALTSAEYARAFDDVRTCGSSSAILDGVCSDPTTPAERVEISRFWLAEGGTIRETSTAFTLDTCAHVIPRMQRRAAQDLTDLVLGREATPRASHHTRGRRQRLATTRRRIVSVS